ncbi:MAG: carboxymuconolactone decarboxylase family protein [Ignavibacteriales bacterium]|nr:carboxymuconolactone decarboxylase family protein [Ignavibacteriales bacterium]
MVETKEDLLQDLKLAANSSFPSLEAMVQGETKYLRDARINLKNVLQSTNFTVKEAYLLALSIAVNEKNDVLSASFTASAKENGATDAEIAETHACTSLLTVNNVFYRFRHFMKKDSYQTMSAGIKMNLMVNPVLGKEFFELMSLAVSSVNGCEACVVSHESSVLKHGASEARVFDAIRLAAVVRGISTFIH